MMKKRRLAKKINTFLTVLVFFLLAVLFLIIFYQKMQITQLTGNISGIYGQETEDQAAEEELLIGIVAKEIGVDREDAAIKAQCVIARTNLYSARETGTELPEHLNREQMKKLWGDYFPAAYRRISKALQETKGETLVYNGHLIYAAYHAVSSGNTRNMEELYPDAKMPYLISRECYEDSMAPDYLGVYYWSRDEFLELCRAQNPDAGLTDCSQIQVAQRDSAGYVLTVQLGNDSCAGESFRESLNLKSANFTIAEQDDKIRIVTKGLGHGFGLSQYTAEKMAEGGSSYEEILAYFFPGSTLQHE